MSGCGGWAAAPFSGSGPSCLRDRVVQHEAGDGARSTLFGVLPALCVRLASLPVVQVVPFWFSACPVGAQAAGGPGGAQVPAARLWV